jgi:hypothetical protein
VRGCEIGGNQKSGWQKMIFSVVRARTPTN